MDLSSPSKLRAVCWNWVSSIRGNQDRDSLADPGFLADVIE